MLAPAFQPVPQPAAPPLPPHQPAPQPALQPAAPPHLPSGNASPSRLSQPALPPQPGSSGVKRINNAVLGKKLSERQAKLAKTSSQSLGDSLATTEPLTKPRPSALPVSALSQLKALESRQATAQTGSPAATGSPLRPASSVLSVLALGQTPSQLPDAPLIGSDPVTRPLIDHPRASSALASGQTPSRPQDAALTGSASASRPLINHPRASLVSALGQALPQPLAPKSPPVAPAPPAESSASLVSASRQTSIRSEDSEMGENRDGILHAIVPSIEIPTLILPKFPVVSACHLYKALRGYDIGKHDFKPSPVLQTLPMADVFTKPIKDVIKRQHDYPITLTETQIRAKSSLLKIYKRDAVTWEQHLKKFNDVQMTDKANEFWKNFYEASNWSLIREEVKIRAQKEGRPVDEHNARDAILQDVLSEYILSKGAATDKVTKSRAKLLLIRLHYLRHDGHYLLVLFRAKSFNLILEGNKGVGITDQMVMQWAEFIKPILSQLARHQTCESERELNDLNMAEEAAFNDEPPEVWSRRSSRWKFVIEAESFHEDYPDQDGATTTYGNGISYPILCKYGYAGNASHCYTWAVQLITFRGGPLLVTVSDLQSGSFLGIIPGWIRYNCNPGENWLAGPNGIWLEPMNSHLYRLFSPRFSDEGNVMVGFEERQDPIHPLKKRFIFLAFASRPISAFEELSI